MEHRQANDDWRGFFPPKDAALIDRARVRKDLPDKETEDLSWLSDVCCTEWCRRCAPTPDKAARLNSDEPWCPGICATLSRIGRGDVL